MKTSVEQRCVRFSLDICSVFIDETDFSLFNFLPKGKVICGLLGNARNSIFKIRTDAIVISGKHTDDNIAPLTLYYSDVVPDVW